MNTPWGQAIEIEHVTNGIRFVKTASHGGYHLTPERNEEIPEAFRKAGGWYEEDCEAAIVAAYSRDECFEARRHVAREMVAIWFPEIHSLHLPV